MALFRRFPIDGFQSACGTPRSCHAFLGINLLRLLYRGGLGFLATRVRKLLKQRMLPPVTGRFERCEQRKMSRHRLCNKQECLSVLARCAPKLGRSNRIHHQHRHGKRSDTSGHRRIGTRYLGNISGVDVANQD